MLTNAKKMVSASQMDSNIENKKWPTGFLMHLVEHDRYSCYD